MSKGDDEPSAPRTKVGRLVHEHDLDGLPTALEAAWLGEGAEQRSLREAANVYDLLDGGDATGGAKVRAERRLDREGVDVEALQSSFVSHQAIHTYLTTVREVEHSDASTGTTDRADAVERLLGRTRSVSEGVVEGLAADGELDIGEFDVSASVHVTCRDCNSRYEFGELRRRGGCRCGE